MSNAIITTICFSMALMPVSRLQLFTNDYKRELNVYLPGIKNRRPHLCPVNGNKPDNTTKRRETQHFLLTN
jgi:hypothetical protein